MGSCSSNNPEVLETQSNKSTTNIENEINPNLKTMLKRIFGPLDDEEIDPYDLCGFFFGNHMFYYEEKLYQIVMVSIVGYACDGGWYSNLDLGCDSPSYYEIDGEHPEWTNKKHHKGFDVTANRAYTILKQFLKQFQNNHIALKYLYIFKKHYQNFQKLNISSSNNTDAASKIQKLQK